MNSIRHIKAAIQHKQHARALADHLSLLVEQHGLKAPEEYVNRAAETGNSAVFEFLKDCFAINRKHNIMQVVQERPVQVERNLRSELSAPHKSHGSGSETNVLGAENTGIAEPAQATSRANKKFTYRDTHPDKSFGQDAIVTTVTTSSEPAYGLAGSGGKWVEKTAAKPAAVSTAAEVSAPQQDMLIAEKWLLRQILKRDRDPEHRMEALALAQADPCLKHLEDELSYRRQHPHRKHYEARMIQDRLEKMRHRQQASTSCVEKKEHGHIVSCLETELHAVMEALHHLGHPEAH